MKSFLRVSSNLDEATHREGCRRPVLTDGVATFAEELGRLTALPVTLQDERLTSHEAESLLATTEKDWRVRKKRLDEVAASIILQDYLDARPRRSVTRVPDPGK